MRAYGYNRPLGMGCYPKGYSFTEMVNFYGKQWVEEVGKHCFGYIDFTEDVPEDMLKAYELVTPEMFEASRPKVPAESVLRKMAEVYKAGDFDKLDKMFDIAERKGYDLEATDAALSMLV